MYLTGTSLTPDLGDVASFHDDVVVRRMVALFDYDPWESSPNMDSEVSAIMTHGPHYVFNRFLQMQLHLLFQIKQSLRSGFKT